MTSEAKYRIVKTTFFPMDYKVQKWVMSWLGYMKWKTIAHTNYPDTLADIYINEDIRNSRANGRYYDEQGKPV